MPSKRVEQHIAVFGESGSGKTVLLSSFFGSMKESGHLEDSRFTLIADKPAQGTQLLQRYYLMRDRAETPESNKYSSSSYPFSLRPKNKPAGK
ncbi:hypothetical protein [Brachybacterium saurashtrense]|nr:hypothetical protein [Brachybacterium saurashtrense]